MPVQHIVAVRFKDTIEAAKVTDLKKGLFDLVNTCKNVEGKTYVRKITGGKENSPGERNKGLSLVFIVEFENEDDRLYYSTQDPVHLAFSAALTKELADAVVLDFTEGVF